ncbi:MAG: ATP/GTP-binding protein [Blastocatellia bacterium]
MTGCPRIVLTGGPCGGKTTLLRELRAADPRGERWLLVPEAAPLLFQAGLDGRRRSFQQAVVKLQIALEESCAEAAHSQQVLLCHRGTLDALAYWVRNGWDEGEFFAATGMSREEHYRRCLGVIHLQTVAIGAEGCYRRWPEAHRPETVEQAAEIDRLCARAWGGHPRYELTDNSGKDWLAKSRIALEKLTRWLALPSE